MRMETDVCSEMRILLDRWTEGSLSRAENETILLHLESCDSCARTYRALVPLIRKDCLGTAALRHEPLTSSLWPRVADAMERKPTGRSRPRPLVFIPAAAAAFALIVFGIVIGGSLRTGTATEELVVTFELSAPEASSVHLVGDFTEWADSALELTDHDGDGVWRAVIKLKKGKVYTYNFLIDEEIWMTDPTSPYTVDDGFGGESSLISL